MIETWDLDAHIYATIKRFALMKGRPLTERERQFIRQHETQWDLTRKDHDRVGFFLPTIGPEYVQKPMSKSTLSYGKFVENTK